MKNTEKTMEQIVNLCKGRGFIFAGSEIYGGLANTWDYGPLGVELTQKVNIVTYLKTIRMTRKTQKHLPLSLYSPPSQCTLVSQHL